MDKNAIECSACSGKGFVPGPCKKCGGKGVVTCSVCNGEGREYKIVCQTCHKGYVTDTRSLDDDKMLCPDCHGNYREDVGPCKECNGKGELSCESCKGTGKTVCATCKGKGKVSCAEFIEVVQLSDIDAFVEKLGFTRHPGIVSSSGKTIKDESYSFLRSFERAKSLFQVHDITREFWKELLNAAKNGNGYATFGLGLCYANDIYYGAKKDKDYEKAAIECFKGAAEQGNGYGQFVYGCECLGCLPEHPKFKELREEGIMWLEKAAAQDVVFALVKLTLIDMYELLAVEDGEEQEERALRVKQRCNKILAINNAGGTNNALFHEFAKVHIGLMDNMLNALETGVPMGAISDDMRKWSKVALVPMLNRQKSAAWPRKSRRVFVLIGIFLGLFGLQFAYVRRWKFFFAHWVALIATLFFPLAFIVCLVLWFGSIFFMKRDGEKVTMD